MCKFKFSNISEGPSQRVEFPKRKTKIVGKDSPITWKTLGITGVLGAGMVAYLLYLKEEQEESKYFIKYLLNCLNFYFSFI